MPFPDFMNIDDADLTLGDSVNLLLASIAYEEFALANLINAEAEKIQYILGTLEDQAPPDPPASLDSVLEINSSADQTLRDVIKKEILLQLKLEKVLGLSSDTAVATAAVSDSNARPASAKTSAAASAAAPTVSSAETPAAVSSETPAAVSSETPAAVSAETSAAAPTAAVNSTPATEGAWIAGTDYGTDCAQYTTLNLGELCKIVNLDLACQRVPVGKVRIVRCSTELAVTISLDDPYFTDQVYLYVGNVPPVISNPEDFPYRFTVTDSADYFTAHTFTVDVSGFLGQTLYISAFARVLS